MTDKPSSERTGRHGPTIRDVARISGVAIGTASKALNQSGRLRQETRDKVREVARRSATAPTTWRRACTAPAR